MFAHTRFAERGFTIPEVIIAGMILIILCVGTLTAFDYAVRINRGNNLRMQALSVLQQEVEFYRSLKFLPPPGSDAAIACGTYTRPPRTSADGTVFSISVTIDDNPSDGTASPEPDVDANTKFKQITITAAKQVTDADGWLQDLNTKVTLQRVRK